MSSSAFWEQKLIISVAGTAVWKYETRIACVRQRRVLVEMAAKIGFLRTVEGQTQEDRIKNTKLTIKRLIVLR